MNASGPSRSVFPDDGAPRSGHGQEPREQRIYECLRLHRGTSIGEEENESELLTPTGGLRGAAVPLRHSEAWKELRKQAWKAELQIAKLGHILARTKHVSTPPLVLPPPS